MTLCLVIRALEGYASWAWLFLGNFIICIFASKIKHKLIWSPWNQTASDVLSQIEFCHRLCYKDFWAAKKVTTNTCILTFSWESKGSSMVCIQINTKSFFTLSVPTDMPELSVKTQIRCHRVQACANICQTVYSWTSLAQTPMARLPWLIWIRFWVPTNFFPIAQENKSLGKFSYSIMKLYVQRTH